MPGERHHTPEFKAKVVLETLSGEKTPSEICRAHKLNINMLNCWRKELEERSPTLFEREEMRSEDQQFLEDVYTQKQLIRHLNI